MAIVTVLRYSKENGINQDDIEKEIVELKKRLKNNQDVTRE